MIIHKGICACYVLPFWYYIDIIYILYKFIKQIEETPDMFLYSGSWWLITEDASLRVSNLMHLGNLTLLPDIHIARLKLSGFLWRLQAMILFSQTWQVKSKIPPPPPPQLVVSFEKNEHCQLLNLFKREGVTCFDRACFPISAPQILQLLFKDRLFISLFPPV